MAAATFFSAVATNFLLGDLELKTKLPKNVAHHGWVMKKILVSRVPRIASILISGNNLAKKFQFTKCKFM